MERITGKEVQSMMEAYASVHEEIKEKEVISEETQELEENRQNRAAELRAAREAKAAAAAQGNSGGPTSPSGGALSMRNRIFARRSASPAAQANTNRVGQNIKVGSPTGPAQNDQLKKTTGAAPTASTTMASKTPANPNVTKDGTKFERRLPTSAELRAAQQARKDAPKVLSRGEIENRAVKAGVGVAKGTVKDPKIAADASRKAELEAIRAKAKADTMKKKESPVPAMSGRMREETELDVFDTIKEYLIGEGATEEEALQQMLTLTDEQRTEIIEGSYGSMKKKKKGGYGK